jgi:hypothetical protein
LQNAGSPVTTSMTTTPTLVAPFDCFNEQLLYFDSDCVVVM